MKMTTIGSWSSLGDLRIDLGIEVFPDFN